MAESTDTGQHLSQNGPVEVCVPSAASPISRSREYPALSAVTGTKSRTGGPPFSRRMGEQHDDAPTSHLTAPDPMRALVT